MAAFQIALLHRTGEYREQRHDLYAPDITAAVVQARALFRALFPDKPSLVSFRIIENGLTVYEFEQRGFWLRPGGSLGI